MSKIISLEAENIKRLKAVTIKPNGAMVVIGGQNDAGKSSVLDSIMYALAGGKTIPAKPLRKGAKKGSIKIDLGELLVERTFQEGGKSQLVITSKDGYEAPTPQTILDDMCGRLAFDPLEFSRQKPRDQLAILRDLVGIDFTGLDAERAAAYQTRTSVNRESKQLEGELAGLPRHDDAPPSEVSMSALLEEIQQAQATNLSNQGKLARLHECEALMNRGEAELQRLEEQARKARENLQALDTNLTRLKAEVADVVDVELEPLRERMRTSESTNAKVRQNAKRSEVAAKLTASLGKSAGLSDRINDIDGEKQKLIESAKFPVPGLGFGDDGITLNGLPFEQASSSERIKVSAAMGLAMNPQLRVMLIRDGSLLGEAALGILNEMAVQADAQIWIERVSEGKEVSVIIEDGSVKEDRTAAKEPAGAAT